MFRVIVDKYKNIASSHLFLNDFLIFLMSSVLIHFILTPVFNWIQYQFSKNPHLVFNVTEIESMKNVNYLENFKLLFGTKTGRVTLLAAQTGDEKLNKIYGEVAVPAERIPCENCTEYTFSIKNVGAKSAKNIVIDLKSISDIKLIDSEKDPKISNVSCGGMLINKGCRLTVDLLNKDESLFFTAIANQKPGIRNISCFIDDEVKECEINLRHYYAQEVFLNTRFDLGGGEIKFPPFNKTDNFLLYYWNPQGKEWNQGNIK